MLGGPAFGFSFKGLTLHPFTSLLELKKKVQDLERGHGMGQVVMIRAQRVNATATSKTA